MGGGFCNNCGAAMTKMVPTYPKDKAASNVKKWGFVTVAILVIFVIAVSVVFIGSNQSRGTVDYSPPVSTTNDNSCTLCRKKGAHTFQGDPYCEEHYDSMKNVYDSLKIYIP
jgi:hypothetical protein